MQPSCPRLPKHWHHRQSPMPGMLTHPACFGWSAPFPPYLNSEKQVPQEFPTCCSDTEGNMPRTIQKQVAGEGDRQANKTYFPGFWLVCFPRTSLWTSLSHVLWSNLYALLCTHCILCLYRVCPCWKLKTGRKNCRTAVFLPRDRGIREAADVHTGEQGA